MGRMLYHNITKKEVNMYEDEFVDTYFDGDIVYKSESGNACIFPVYANEINEILKLYNEEKEE